MTGIAILASGYSQLACGLSSYHWQIIIYLAWFSSLTHLTTLTVLRPYLHKYHLLLLLRLLFMATVLCLLGYALLPTGNAGWLTELQGELVLGVPAQCFYKQLFAHENYPSGSSQFNSMLTSLLVLTSSYLMRVIKLSQKGSRLTRYYLRSKPGAWWKNRLHQRAVLYAQASATWNRSKLLLHRTEVTVFVMVLAAFDIVESTLWEVSQRISSCLIRQ